MRRFILFFALLSSCNSVDEKKPDTPSSPNTQSSAVRPLPAGREVLFALSDSVTTLDPRKVQGMASSCITELLFEGLTKVDPQGNVLPGVATNIHVSPDMNTYTFTLRDAKWSNGDPVTASDFEYSWKSQLTADTKAAANYLLFAIRSAKAAYEGNCPLEQVAISCPDEKTLVVTLENPAPYFLRLTATPTYFPVHQKWTEEDANQHSYITNGLYSLESWKPHEAIDLKRNDQHHAAAMTDISKIHCPIVNEEKAYITYEDGKLDWIGTPLCPINPEDYTALQTAGKLKTAPAAGTFFVRINTETGPFSNQKFRQAFCLAINAQEIINETMKEAATVATSFVPPSLGLTSTYYTSNDTPRAQLLFKEALEELHITQDSLPPISFCFVSSPTMKKIGKILQKNWEEAFGIGITLQDLEAPVFYDNVLSKDYML
ncbi:MAG: peptide ABC transporter substrate-binding protein, partial [Verrucomicrobia bacterium]|nr:peptide ABC transporter substrate-binding protein [Verrucomicrobiota bacterium]